MLFKWLIRVQRCDFAFDQGDGSGSSGFHKVVVYLRDSSISLHELSDILAREVLYYLELFVPVMHLLWIDAVERH